jgi:hypothetical protein
MLLGYRAALALTSLVLLPVPVSAAQGPHGLRHHRHAAGARTAGTLGPLSAQAVFSRHALRQARIILQLKLLELRSERLDRVKKAIEAHEPLEQLLKEP